MSTANPHRTACGLPLPVGMSRYEYNNTRAFYVRADGKSRMFSDNVHGGVGFAYIAALDWLEERKPGQTTEIAKVVKRKKRG